MNVAELNYVWWKRLSNQFLSRAHQNIPVPYLEPAHFSRREGSGDHHCLPPPCPFSRHLHSQQRGPDGPMWYFSAAPLPQQVSLWWPPHNAVSVRSITCPQGPASLGQTSETNSSETGHEQRGSDRPREALKTLPCWVALELHGLIKLLSFQFPSTRGHCRHWDAVAQCGLLEVKLAPGSNWFEGWVFT